MSYHVRYEEVTHDGPRTMEQQLFLLARDAHRAWTTYHEKGDLDNPMVCLIQRLAETDIFMGGYAEARTKSDA